MRTSIDVDYETEGRDRYFEGGFCPIDIGDRIADRFTVLHKLGYSGYSTVWLVRDEERRHGNYVALKVISAQYSDRYETPGVLELIRRFEEDHGFPGRFLIELERVFHTSPNGRHLCQVFSVLGPSLSSVTEATHRLYPSYIKGFARELTEAVDIMHSMGIFHGDLTLHNVAIRLAKPLDCLTKDQLLEIIGLPLAQRFKPRGVEEDSPHWPEFAYLNADLGLLPPEYFSTRLCILDFDQAFLANDPPRAISNIPLPYLAPESIFTLTNGPAADIWALGSILFCLRDTCHLFQPFTFSTIEGTVMEMCTLLGLPPKEWWKVPFHDGLPIHGPLPPDMEHYYLIQEMDDNSGKRGLEYWVRRIKEPVPASESTPKTAIQQLCLSVPVFNALNDREEKDFEARHMTPIQEKDADLFFDLLRKIFTYDRHKRATAEQILEHPWLKDSGLRSDVTNTQNSVTGESGKDASRESAMSEEARL